MARALHKLSDVAVKAVKASGRHSDGGGLYLWVSPSGSKSWLFMWARDGKRREMGLPGPASAQAAVPSNLLSCFGGLRCSVGRRCSGSRIGRLRRQACPRPGRSAPRGVAAAAVTAFFCRRAFASGQPDWRLDNGGLCPRPLSPKRQCRHSGPESRSCPSRSAAESWQRVWATGNLPPR
ncbi:Arm DNA-binding domain-containing protein [Mesorhizobium sp.]|uniref:Arm DNA-binding domain-containing protein n=1 Tax=Mesorhizobium sp. TaxID=1871066 RepID=UPI00338EC724